MDNAKKQTMSDEELAGISGGADVPSSNISTRACPFCHNNNFGRGFSGEELKHHMATCPKNPYSGR